MTPEQVLSTALSESEQREDALRRQLRDAQQRIAALEAELAAQKQKTAAILNERINSVAEWKEAGELDNEALDFNLRQRIAALEGVIRADDERLLKATERVGLAPMGCDTADWLAEEVLGLRRAAAARLRAVKRMKRVARHYQLLALRLAVGAELSGVAKAAQRDAARAAGRGE